MLKPHIQFISHSRKLLAAALMLSLAGLAVASMGGEKKSKKASSATADFVPIKTTSGFTLKAGPSYKGSLGLSSNKAGSGHLNINTLVTYQKGNTTYIMPYNSRISIGKSTACNNSTEMLNLKVRLNQK